MEMLADLHPTQARELVDEYPSATVEAYLREHSGEKSWSDSDARKASSILSSVAADCTAAQRMRSTPAAVLPKLERAFELAAGLYRSSSTSSVMSSTNGDGSTDL
jgi:hypothetical protein